MEDNTTTTTATLYSHKDANPALSRPWLPEKPITDGRELLDTLIDIVENHEEAYDQTRWLGGHDQDEAVDEADEEARSNLSAHLSPFWTKGAPTPVLDLTDIREGRIDCGTTCCVAGWAVTLAGGKWVSEGYVVMPGNPEKEGAVSWVAGDILSDALGLITGSEEWENFRYDEWPEIFDGDAPPSFVIAKLHELRGRLDNAQREQKAE